MIEHGSYRIVGNNFQIDSVIQQNNILKKQNSNLTTWLAISLIVAGVVVIYVVSKDLRKNELDD
jgi:hypothetical protein